MAFPVEGDAESKRRLSNEWWDTTLTFPAPLQADAVYRSPGVHQIHQEPYEERRRAILRKSQGGYDYQVDEFSDYDLESLRVLSCTITTLLKWEPASRASAQEALAHIGWVDYRNEA